MSNEQWLQLYFNFLSGEIANVREPISRNIKVGTMRLLTTSAADWLALWLLNEENPGGILNWVFWVVPRSQSCSSGTYRTGNSLFSTRCLVLISVNKK